MAIDHGLQGRNSDKSRRKRFNKAKKTKAIALGALTKDRKVVFNEESRVEWLSGFHKRKLQRRKFGLAMQIIKDKKTNKQNGKESRGLNSQMKKDSIQKLNENIVDNDNAMETHSIITEILYDDNQSQNMFGSSVSVVINDDLNQFMSKNTDHFETASQGSKASRTPSRQERFQSELGKAIKQVKSKNLLNKKKPKKSKFSSGKTAKTGKKNSNSKNKRKPIH